MIALTIIKYWLASAVDKIIASLRLPCGAKRSLQEQTYVEGSKTTAVTVEGLVVEINKLFCLMNSHSQKVFNLCVYGCLDVALKEAISCGAESVYWRMRNRGQRGGKYIRATAVKSSR